MQDIPVQKLGDTQSNVHRIVRPIATKLMLVVMTTVPAAASPVEGDAPTKEQTKETIAHAQTMMGN